MKDSIERVLEYIEQRLKPVGEDSELSLADLARVAGYSEYHFLRLFKKSTELTPADYIRKRRLSEIVRAAERSGRPISEHAFEYGFNSKENFTRAFVSEHRALPTEYKAAGNSLKLFERMRLEPASLELVPQIVTLPAFKLRVFLSDELKPYRFWNRYNVQKLSQKLSGGKVVADYGVSDWHEDEQKLYYYIGIRSDEAFGDLAGTMELEMQGGLYARFDTPASTQLDFVNVINKTWGDIKALWLPQSGYKLARAYEFETYIETSRTFTEQIYIPIEKN